jgi:hypothetical protein
MVVLHLRQMRPCLRHISRTWLARGALAAASLGCADANPAVEPPPLQVAAFAAIGVNGVPLPYELAVSGSATQFVDYEVLRLYRDGTADRGEMVRTVQANSGEVVRSTTMLRYRYSYIGDTLRVVAECATDGRCPAPLDYLRDNSGLRRILSTNPMRVITYARGLED